MSVSVSRDQYFMRKGGSTVTNAALKWRYTAHTSLLPSGNTQMLFVDRLI